RSRYRLTAIIAVSAMEKKPEATSSAARATSRLLRGVSSKPDRRLPIGTSIWPQGAPVKECAPPSAPENHLEHELAAGVGEDHQGSAREDPFERAAPTPAIAMPTEEQGREYEPSKHREHDLVGELQRF